MRKKGTSNGPKRNISWPDFIRAWQAASTIKECAKILGLDPNNLKDTKYLAVRATWGRTKGIPLKKRQRLNTSPEEWAGFAKLAQECLEEE